jgi:hypothetical protein
MASRFKRFISQKSRGPDANQPRHADSVQETAGPAHDASPLGLTVVVEGVAPVVE